MRKGIFKRSPSVKQPYGFNSGLGISSALRLLRSENAMLLAFSKNEPRAKRKTELTQLVNPLIE